MDAKSMAAAILLFSIGADEGNEPQNACGVAAMTDYTKANLALMQQGSPAMSVEATIAHADLKKNSACGSSDASSMMRTACDLRRRSTLVSATK
jgi:hypothetical protein